MLKLFQLNNTDEIWWRTLVNMKAEGLEVEKSVHEFKIMSGTGQGIYAINKDNSQHLSFQTKIIRNFAINFSVSILISLYIIFV